VTPVEASNEETDGFDWEQWPVRRAELTAAIRSMREQFGSFDSTPELEPLRQAGEKLANDLENVIAAGDEEYRRVHPGAQFEASGAGECCDGRQEV